MSNKETVELTLDTTAGVEQFLEYVQDVVFVAARYEAEALEAALSDPTHILGVDVLSNELHELYAVMRTEIAAAAASGGMTHEVAEHMQVQYNELCRLRDQFRIMVPPITSKSALVTSSSNSRKTLEFQNQNTDGSIRITDKSKSRKKRSRKKRSDVRSDIAPAHPPVQPKVQPPQNATTKEFAAPVRAEHSKVRRAVDDLPSPGVIKPAPLHSLEQLPLLSLVTDGQLKKRIQNHQRPKQLEFQVKAIIDRIEASQTDKLSAWLGEAKAHTFAYIQTLSLQELYAQAALPITEMRAELTPKNIRPEALLHWVQVVTDVQAIYPAQPTQLVGEVVVSALVTQELAA